MESASQLSRTLFSSDFGKLSCRLDEEPPKRSDIQGKHWSYVIDYIRIWRKICCFHVPINTFSSLELFVDGSQGNNDFPWDQKKGEDAAEDFAFKSNKSNMYTSFDIQIEVQILSNFCRNDRNVSYRCRRISTPSLLFSCTLQHLPCARRITVPLKLY